MVTARISFNRNRMILLYGAFGTGVFLLVTVMLLILQLGVVAPVVALVAAIGWCLAALRKGSSIVLELSDAAPASPQDHARLYNVTIGLCAAMGLAVPDLYISEEPALNALATGRDEQHASLVFTQGLLEELSLIELEAVTSWLLYKIRSGDITPETFVVLSIGTFGVWRERFSLPEFADRLLALPTPLVDRVIAWIHPSRAQLDTDLAAVGATRYPPALATALEKLDGRSAIAAASPVTEHLWIAPPLALSARPAVAHIHPQLRERVAVLQEL